MAKERQEITGSNCPRDSSGKLTVDERGIEDMWRQHTYQN